jgi:Fe-S cluster assembly ATPase SufC
MAAMNERVDALIAEIAARHGIAVSRDDPIMVLQTINSLLLHETARSQQDQLDQFKQEMEALTLRWEGDSKSKSERILNAALAAGKDAMWSVMQEGAGAASIAMRSEIDDGVGQLQALIRNARRIALVTMVASCSTLLAAAIVLWVACQQ